MWRVLVALIAAACVVQIFLAGRGAFGVHGAAKSPHSNLGMQLAGLHALDGVAILALSGILAHRAWRAGKGGGEPAAPAASSG